MLDERKKHSYRCGLILIGVTILVYFTKNFLIKSVYNDIDNRIIQYLGIILIVLGVIYTFMERKMNLPFFYGRSQRGGSNANSYVVLGNGVALTTNTWVSMLIMAVVFAVLAVGIRYFFTPHDEK